VAGSRHRSSAANCQCNLLRNRRNSGPPGSAATRSSLKFRWPEDAGQIRINRYRRLQTSWSLPSPSRTWNETFQYAKQVGILTGVGLSFTRSLTKKEFLGELPPEAERLFREVRQPQGKAIPRAVVSTRPMILRKGEKARISAEVAGGGQVGQVTLFTRAKDSDRWNPSPMSLAGRRTYASEIKWQEGGR